MVTKKLPQTPHFILGGLLVDRVLAGITGLEVLSGCSSLQCWLSNTVATHSLQFVITLSLSMPYGTIYPFTHLRPPRAYGGLHFDSISHVSQSPWHVLPLLASALWSVHWQWQTCVPAAFLRCGGVQGGFWVVLKERSKESSSRLKETTASSVFTRAHVVRTLKQSHKPETKYKPETKSQTCNQF